MRPLLLVLALLVAPAVSAQTIGVYRDVSAGQCPVIPPFMPTTIHVVATSAPNACGGIQGAAFRLAGWPANWFYHLSYGPVIPAVIGDPFGSGIYIAFPVCQQPTALLLSITVIATSSVSDVPLTVEPHVNAMPPLLCPVVALCNAPVLTQICATGVTTRINPTDGSCPCQGPCFEECPPVSVEHRSWTRIKKLFD